MATDELRAAAERLRGVTANGLSLTYGAGNRAAAHRQFGRDQATLAYAWLAEHPADDDEPVTEAWLREVNWAPVGNTWYTAEEDCNTPIVFWVSVDRTLRVAGLKDWKISEPTRGQFRRLLAALTST